MADESSVRVAVRIRPQTPGEVVEGCGVCARAGGAAGAGGVALGTERAFTFDFAFEPTGDQEQVYDTCVRKLVDAALEGYNATVLAYGQTGSGKTYTMGSGWEDAAEGAARRGIIPRAIRDLFAGADARADEARARGQLPPEFSVHAQFIELYNEDIVDLLDPARDAYAKGGLRIAEDGCGGVRIVGASCKPVRGAADALGVLRAGALARTTAATNMNSSSSRSHAVFTLMMRQRRLADEEEGGGVEKEEAEPEQYETLTAKFHFVDLAGSERLKRTGATGERAREGISINCGLLALGNVISALGDRARRAAHVPYRDSKLTRLLQDSLGGNSNTVMIACISPSDRDFMETLNTLKYANRARNIKNRCFVNQDLSSRTIGALRREIERLQGELADYKQGKRTAENGAEGWSDVAQENAILTAELDTLRRRCKALQATVDQLASKNAQLLAARALGACAEGGGGEGDEPREGGDAECALTTLVQGYASEIEDLRAQLLAANALYEGDARRRRARADSHDAAGVLEDAKRELEKERRLLARSMQDDIGERERAEGESDSEPDAEPAPDMTLSAELAALSSDIDTKQRLIEELELSQRRLDALKTHYETRLDTLHHQIRATQDERDKVLASYANQPSPQPEKTSAIRAEYTARLGEMSRELRRLNAAAREHARLQAAHAQQALAVRAARDELAGMKRDKVKLVQRMRADARRHAAAEAARAREVAQLRKQGRRHAHLIRSLEADKLLKEQVLRRKQEEVSLLRRGHRDKLSPRAAGRVNGNDRTHAHLWSRISPWLSRTAAARAELAAQEAGLERCLRRRRAASPAARARLQAEIDDAQASIMQLAEETDESEVSALLAGAWSAEAARHALAQLLAHALTSAGEAAAAQRRLRDATERIRELEQAAHASPPLSFSPGGGDGGGGVDGGGGGGGLSEWSAAVLAAIPSGTCTRPVSPTLDFSAVEPRPVPEGVREFAAHATAPASPARDPPPFQRNTGRRGSVRLRDLGVVSRDASPDCMTQSLLEPPAAAPAPLARVPSAPGGLRYATLQMRSPGAAGAWSLQCTHVAEGHVGAALALAATAHALYSGGVDRTVRAWDVAAGAEGWRGACAGAVGALAAGPALPVLLAAAGACVRVFDTRASQPVHTLWSSGAVGAAPPARAGGETAVSALAVRRHLLYTAAGDRLRLWDLRKLECITKVYTGHAAAVMCLAVGGAGAGAGADLLCTGSKDHYVRTLELNQETREAARRVLHPPHYDGVQALALLEGGALYSASRDSSIKRWDLHSGALTHGVMSAHAGWVSGLAACGAGGAGGGGGGAALASSGRDGRLRLWSAALGAAASARAPDALHAVAAGDGLLYTAGNGGEVRVWRVDDGAASCSP